MGVGMVNSEGKIVQGCVPATGGWELDLTAMLTTVVLPRVAAQYRVS